MKLTIFGNPIAKMRPRFSRQGGFMRAYDPQEKEIKALKKVVVAQLKELLNHDDPEIVRNASSIALNRAFRVDLYFYLPLPKTAKKSGFWHPCTDRRDLDNFCKATLDILNGIVYEDDSQVVELHAVKLYSENPRTEIFIMPIKNFTFDDTNHVLEHFTPCQLDRFFRDLCYLVDSMRALDLGDEYDKVLVGLEDDQFAKKMIEFSKKYSPIISKIGKLKIDKHEEKS